MPAFSIPFVTNQNYYTMNYLRVLLIGIAATLVMTAFMAVASYTGLQDMNAGQLLGAMFGDSIVIGWTEHFAAGIIFAFVYARFANQLLPVENNIARGAIYGIFLFILSEIVFTGVSFLGYLSWHEKESMAQMVFGEGLACLLYGSVLGAFVNKNAEISIPHFKPLLHSINQKLKPKPAPWKY